LSPPRRRWPGFPSRRNPAASRSSLRGGRAFRPTRDASVLKPMVDASLPGQACQGRVPSDAPRRSERCALVLETPGPAGRLAAMDLSLSLAAAGPPAQAPTMGAPPRLSRTSTSPAKRRAIQRTGNLRNFRRVRSANLKRPSPLVGEGGPRSGSDEGSIALSGKPLVHAENLWVGR
jgi:hypothetical protein